MKKNKVLDLAYIAMFTALIAICSWISIPLYVPITMQTFAVFAAIGFLGLKRGTIAVSVYILLGLVGVPVFAGFKGGIGALAGPTGGYIIGFLFTAVVSGLIIKKWGNKPFVLAAAFAAGLIICYVFGTVWFVAVYSSSAEKIGFYAALLKCVFPFILPDAVKISLAVLVVNRVGRLLNKRGITV